MMVWSKHLVRIFAAIPPWRSGLLILSGTGRAMTMTHGQGAQNQLPPMPRWKRLGNGNMLVLTHQRNSKGCRLLVKWWLQCSGTARECSWFTNYKSVKPLMGSIIICLKLKETIKYKRQGKKLLACVLLLRDNAPVYTTQVVVAVAEKCGLALLPHAPYSQIWHYQISAYSQNWNHTCGTVILRVTITLYVLLKAIFGLRLQTSSEKGSQSLNIGCQSALKFRGLCRKIHISINVFLLRPRTFWTTLVNMMINSIGSIIVY